MSKRGSDVVKVCSCCACSITKAQWERLKLVGKQHVEAGDGEPAFTLELRNCQCGTTLAVEI